MTSILSISGFNFSYGYHQVLCDISLDIRARDILVLTGSNGAGKTTLLRLLGGFLKPQGSPGDFKMPRARFFSPQGGLYEDLTLAQNLELFSGLADVSSEQALELAHEMGISSLLHRTVSELSYGQRLRGSLCRTFLATVPLYLLDEPFTGLDSEAQEVLFKVLVAQQMKGSSFLISTHDPGKLAFLSRRQISLVGGRLTEIPAETGEASAS